MGTPADARTRRERSTTHECFDRLWRTGLMSRTQAYAWMQRSMGITPDAAHISRMDIRECRRLVRLLEESFPELFPLST